MRKIFLSFHFDVNGKFLADIVSELVQSHGLQVQTGERLAGADLSGEITRRIDESDGLVCLLTEREEDRNGNWVRDERARAYAKGKRVIALVQKGVDDPGLYQDKERIRYDSTNPIPALLKLSSTLGIWRQEAGRMLVAQIEPDEAVRFLSAQGDFAKIRYRCWMGPTRTEWKDDARFKEVPGGVQVYIPGIREDQDIEIQIKNAEQIWQSSAISQIFRIPLSKR